MSSAIAASEIKGTTSFWAQEAGRILAAYVAVDQSSWLPEFVHDHGLQSD